LAAVTPHRAAVVDELVDSDTFFERAARGERDTHPTTTAPDRALGAATLPRTPPPAAVRRQLQPNDDRHTGKASKRLVAPRAGIVALPAAVIVVGAVLVGTSPGGRGGSEVAAVIERSPAQPPPADFLAPRVGHVSVHGQERFAGIAYDPGSGVRSVELVADGRRRAIQRGACRPACPPAMRFSFSRNSSKRLRAVAIVVVDAAGNKALAWQTLAVDAPKPLAAKLTARLERAVVAPADYAIAGRLNDAGGLPIRHGRVELVGVERTDDAVPRVVGAATTDTAGRWRVAGLKARHGSQLYRARYIAGGESTVVSAPVRATVRANLALRARRQGRVTVLTGRLHPAAAARLLLAVPRAGGWRTGRTARATANGRFRLRIPGRPRRRVAVFVAPSPDLPYAPVGRVIDLTRP
jgi:hypothetical protein